MALDATPGGSTSNSYITVVEADAYFENRIHSSGWDNADNPEAALITATKMLDWYMRWKGDKASTNQALDWPRANFYDREGNLYDDSVIPQRIKDAVAELALFSLDEDRVAEGSLDGIAEIQVGPIEIKSDAYKSLSSKKKAIPKHVREMLTDYVINTLRSTRLIRA